MHLLMSTPPSCCTERSESPLYRFAAVVSLPKIWYDRQLLVYVLAPHALLEGPLMNTISLSGSLVEHKPSRPRKITAPASIVSI